MIPFRLISNVHGRQVHSQLPVRKFKYRSKGIINNGSVLLIHNQVITGEKVFEYFGKLVEGKKAQEERTNEGKQNESDQGQCSINEDGELEGWCGSGSDVEFSMITEENDDDNIVVTKEDVESLYAKNLTKKE